MGDRFEEVTRRSWGQRIAGSFGGMVVGILLVLVAIAALWWNEGRSVDRLEALKMGRQLVVPVTALDPANEGRLVHIAGLATTSEILADPVFPVSVQAIRLTRTAQIYQWHERKETRTETELGGSEKQVTVYSYARDWADAPLDSSAFRQPGGHANTGAMPFRSASLDSDRVDLGPFRLTGPFVARIDNARDLRLDPDLPGRLPADLRDRYRIQANALVTGDLAAPQVGDIRVSFTWVPPTDVSAIGRQTGDRLTPYATPTGSLELLENRIVDPSIMFATAESDNSLLTWAIRLAGILFIGIGIALILRPVATLGDVVPLFGSLLGAGIGLVATIAALTLGFTVIALAWLAYRPLLGAGLLLLALAAIAGGIWLMRRRRRLAA